VGYAHCGYPYVSEPTSLRLLGGMQSLVDALRTPRATGGGRPVAGERLRGIASEWSAQFPGYLAGAVDAAERAVTAHAARDAR